MESSGGASPFDRIMLHDIKGEERWSARDLQQLMGYDEWRKFEGVIQRAMDAVNGSGLDALDHFVGAAKVMQGGRWGRQQVTDYRLTRFGAYHVALAGDGRKPEVAAAKTYFAIQTRNAEVAAAVAPALPQDYEEALVELLSKVRQNKALAAENKVLAPKAGKWDAFCDAEGLIGMTAIADMLDVPVTKMTNWLVEEDIFRKQRSRLGANQNMPRRHYQTNGYFTIKMESNGRVFYEVAYATTQGADFVFDRWQARAAA
ncbi:phage antirepressor KilAC domain-containing protein [Streptomyces sp. UH6]|uniref:phage antirepressor KilAC domain-containing protein n=1 Tax=Streptomyces sp. UH6 TaxID=2748379 RepID=UPI0015D521A9|nr:phage antirepressor KilAC domain-containing protein [Streptomyces sp. UH6]NYV74214.1 phage antirepressor KilAC domain-containing protein [Streptomyces sp. UH6]